MATSYREQAILATVGVETSGNAYTHKTIEVTKTATMANGSFLVGTAEAAIADVATVDGILDFPEIELYADGDVMLVRVAENNVIANYDVVQFSDAAFGGEALAILDAKGVKFQKATAEFEYK